VLFFCAEVVIGKVLGRGGFAVVNEVKGFRVVSQQGVKKSVNRKVHKTSSKLSDISKSNPLDETMSSIDTRETSGSNEARKRAVAADKERFVVKQVCDDVTKTDRLTFMKGVVDMAIEAKFLANLSHPNIIELRGISAGGPYREGFFLIMERLETTLADRIKSWMLQDQNCKGITGVFLGSKKKVINMIYEQYRAAYNVADAINYLHQKKIIYRDLKPSNMGFTTDDVLKLFDFGLAKELRDDEHEGKGLYNMTGMTGALRYMAPGKVNDG
jgi:serine/threonine protein kinase